MSFTKRLLTFGAGVLGLVLLFHVAAHRAAPPLPPEPASAPTPDNSHPLAEAQGPAGPSGFSVYIAALHRSNPEEIQAAFQALMDYVAQHPGESSAVLEALKAEADYPRFLSWLGQLAADNPSGQPQQVFKRWAIELAQTDPSLPAQQTALAWLARVRPEAELLPVLSQIYHNAADPQLQVTAIATLQNWSEENQDPLLRLDLGRNLVGMINSSSAPEVRQRGFAALARVGLPDDTLVKAADLLWQEPVEANRSLLAMSFDQASQPVRDFAVEKLEHICNQVTDLDTQRAALAQIVRLAKAQSPPILQRVGASHPELQKDVAEYLQILQAGATAIAVIDRRKLELDAAAGP